MPFSLKITHQFVLILDQVQSLALFSKVADQNKIKKLNGSGLKSMMIRFLFISVVEHNV